MLACPYCYNQFPTRDISFRCTGLPGPGGQVCGVERDENLVRWLGNSTPLPPAFAADGRKNKAKCPGCHGETNYHICPICHNRLPVHFGQADSRLIAMIGAQQSGKTVFMTVLIHELKHRVGRNLDASIMGADEDTRKSFDRDYDDRLYKRHALPDTTQRVAAPSTRHPLVFSMTMQQPKGLLSRPCERQTILSFFDTAGEDLTSSDGVEQNVRYLRSASAIILLLDPLQMPGARSRALENAILPPAGADLDQPINVLTRVTELLRGSLTSHPSQLIQIPIAVAFSKLDSLQHTFQRDSPLTQRREPQPRFDTRDSLAVHDQVQALLDDWDGPQIDQLMRHNYARYRYFGISALGAPPRDASTVSQIRPHRVDEPFLWLLSEFGTIRATRG